MPTNSIHVSVKGRQVQVPAAVIDGRTMVVTGRWLRTVSIFDEDWDSKTVENPEKLMAGLRVQLPQADIFTFAQKLPETAPKFSYSYSWDNLAAIRVTEYSAWWNGLPQATRRNVRIAEKKKMVVRRVLFDDDLVCGIKRIYDESAIRQGRRFWHYGKDLETVRRENSSYVDRSHIIGAFLGEELIGFLKMVCVGRVASIMQIISLNKHQDKKPMNALLAKAVEVCSIDGLEYLVYCQYVYGKNTGSPLTEFKRRNGFQQVLLPRYYIPLTARGRVALGLNCHRGLRSWIPGRIECMLQAMRAGFYDKSAAKRSEQPAEASSS